MGALTVFILSDLTAVASATQSHERCLPRMNDRSKLRCGRVYLNPPSSA